MRIVICLPDSEDRELCRRRINEIAKIDRFVPTIEVVNTADVGDRYFSPVDYADMDIIYLGISREFNGIRIAQSIRKAGIHAEIVFYTRFTDAVFSAFDVDALHYLVSGKISSAKFDEVFRKAVSRAESRTQASIVLSCAGEQRRIIISQIYYFEVINRIVTVHYRGGSFEFYSTLQKLEDSLIKRGFVRVHRAFLVAERFITAFNRDEITLSNGVKIPVGGKYINNIHLQ